MKLVMLAAAGETDEDLEAVEGAATALLEGDCPDATPSTPIVPGACFNLVFDQSVSTSTWTVDVPAAVRGGGVEISTESGST